MPLISPVTSVSSVVKKGLNHTGDTEVTGEIA